MIVTSAELGPGTTDRVRRPLVISVRLALFTSTNLAGSLAGHNLDTRVTLLLGLTHDDT